MRGINDQRIIGVVALYIGISGLMQVPQAVSLSISTIQIVPTSLSLDLRIFTDLMIVGGAYLILAKDTSARWFIAATLPLQMSVVTALLSAKTATISGSGFHIGDLVIAILIYRQIIKLILLEIINNSNSSNNLANGGQVNGPSSTSSNEPNIAGSNSWYSSNIGLNLATVSTSDQPVVAKQDERSVTDDGESN